MVYKPLQPFCAFADGGTQFGRDPIETCLDLDTDNLKRAEPGALPLIRAAGLRLGLGQYLGQKKHVPRVNFI